MLLKKVYLYSTRPRSLDQAWGDHCTNRGHKKAITWHRLIIFRKSLLFTLFWRFLSLQAQIENIFVFFLIALFSFFSLNYFPFSNWNISFFLLNWNMLLFLIGIHMFLLAFSNWNDFPFFNPNNFSFSNWNFFLFFCLDSWNFHLVS